MKTNAARLLDQLGIAYELRTYDVSDEHMDAEVVTIELFEAISVSAGMRGAQLVLAPAGYLRATRGTVAPIARAKGQGAARPAVTVTAGAPRGRWRRRSRRPRGAPR